MDNFGFVHLKNFELVSKTLILVFSNLNLNMKQLMEQHTLKIVNNSLNTNIYSYLETSGGQSSNPYLKVVH